MNGIRTSFDALMKKYSLLKDEFKFIFHEKVFKSQDFENGIVKIQMNQEVRLTDDEKEAVHVFLIEDIDKDVEERELSFVESVLPEAEAQQKKRARVSKYRSTAHITPVSSIFEQTNLISKHIMNDCRKQMDPSSLEMLMILKLNPDLWDEKTVNAVIGKTTEHESSVTNTPLSLVSSLRTSSSSYFSSSTSSFSSSSNIL